jgi:peptidoglycan/LPS O-acetylase OafA/YrhL
VLGGRITALDAVRGIAILGVMATHSLTATITVTDSSLFPPEVFRLFSYGEFGVQLFFVLSGWLMFSLYTGDRPFSQPVYWARRWARIWPLWVIFVSVTFVAVGVPDAGLPAWLSFLLCISFLGWFSAALIAVPSGGQTIQQEMGHYLLFSVFRRRSVAFLAGTVIVGYASMAIARGIVATAPAGSFLNDALSAWLRLALFNSWPFFLLGGAGFALLRRWRRDGIGALAPGRSWTAVVIVLALCASMLSTYSGTTPGYFVLGFVLACAAVAVVSNDIPLVGPTLRSIGRYSYFMYFFHFWVLVWLENAYAAAGGPSGGTTSMVFNIALLVAMLALTTALSWAAGVASWNVLEKRCLAWAHRKVPAPSRRPSLPG